MHNPATTPAADLESTGVRHAVATDRIERWLLSAGYWSPLSLATEMTKHDLRVHDFAGPFHHEVVAAILGHADLGFEPTVASMKFVTTELGCDWSIGDGGNLERIIFATSHPLLIGHYADLLASIIARRRRSHELIEEAEMLLGGESPSVPTWTPAIRVEPARARSVIPTVPSVRPEVARG